MVVVFLPVLRIRTQNNDVRRVTKTVRSDDSDLAAQIHVIYEKIKIHIGFRNT